MECFVQSSLRNVELAVMRRRLVRDIGRTLDADPESRPFLSLKLLVRGSIVPFPELSRLCRGGRT